MYTLEVTQKFQKQSKAKDTVDVWSDTLTYWSKSSTVALRRGWDCKDVKIKNCYFIIYDINDSIYSKLLDECESKVSQAKYSKIVEKVVSNQINL